MGALEPGVANALLSFECSRLWPTNVSTKSSGHSAVLSVLLVSEATLAS